MRTFVIIAMVFLNFVTTSLAQKSFDYLIFPDPGKQITVVKAADYRDLPVGELLPVNDKLGLKIINELQLPFHKSVIRLSQCARNFVKDTAGSNVLFLSSEEGGFPRHGLILKKEGKEISYPDLNYVDLVVNEDNFEKSELSIYSHELGHVMMAIIMKDLPRRNSVLQHVSMGITDYMVAFSEGWGEHFQIEACMNIPKYKDYFQKKSVCHNPVFLWHSNLDEDLRQSATLQNRYIFDKLLPSGITPDSLTQEQLILAFHTSPVFNPLKLKNAQQMLSCEGVLSSLFYLINAEEPLAGRYEKNDFYNKFLLSPIPENVNPSDIFNKYENVMLKNFYVWDKIKTKVHIGQSIPMIEFIVEWCNSFPDDREKIVELFIKATIGKTVSDIPGKIFERAAFYGSIGDYATYKKLKKEYEDSINKTVRDVLNGSVTLDKNTGNELWAENKNFTVRTTLWSDKNKKPLKININTASAYELAVFPGIGMENAVKIIQAREKTGYFKSLGEAEQHGFTGPSKGM